MRYLSLFALLAVACVDQDEVSALTGLERPSTIPEWAVEVAPDRFSLGSDFDPATGDPIEGMAIVDRHPGLVETHEAEPRAFTGDCHASMGYGSWTVAEPWGLDATNSSGLTATQVKAKIARGQAVWEDASGVQIFGDYTAAFSGQAADLADDENNVQFGDAGGGGTVAVTYVWSGGAGQNRYIVEWDQIYEDTEPFTVGTPDPNSFDLLNVAAHEIGHAAGMDHPHTSCRKETMYAYVVYGEKKKRTLGTGDIAGIAAAY